MIKRIVKTQSPSPTNEGLGNRRRAEESVARDYLKFYETPFGREVLRIEAGYIRGWLGDCNRILDVGCGPGAFEGELPELNIVGIDSNPKMIKVARENSDAEFKVGSAEKLPFPNSSFDGVFLVSALAFIDDYRKAIDEVARTLIPNGKIVALLCNTESNYFREKLASGRYTASNIKHNDMKSILAYLSTRFDLDGEYMIGVDGDRLSDTVDAKMASIYAVKGTVKSGGRK